MPGRNQYIPSGPKLKIKPHGKEVNAGALHWTKKVGRLPGKDERTAELLQNPADFGEIVLGYKFYPKQREALEMCMDEGCNVAIAAANGAGKTSRILSTLVLWHQFLWPCGKCKVTSGAYSQIEDQIWPAIRNHKDKFPQWKWYETPNIVSPSPFDPEKTGFFRGFTTNEPGRAEGDHPDNMHDPGADGRFIVPLLFIVDEAKTSPIWLRGVLEGRVRPTRLVLMSSHGFAEGWFYEAMSTLGKFRRITISVDDCPHISKEEIEGVRRDWAGVPAFADSILGFGFMPLVEDAAIPGPALDECINHPPPFKEGDRHLFCDFAWSSDGDENVAALRNGNEIKIVETFRCDHLLATDKNPEPGIVERFIQMFERLNFSRGDTYQISGDEGGGGKLVMDALEEKGWLLNRVSFGGTAYDNERYANIAAEMWFEFAKGITHHQFILPNDRMARGQLLNRKRVKDEKQKLRLESKRDMKARGVPSPDRGDAIVGCAAPTGGYGGRCLDWAQAVQVGEYQTSAEGARANEMEDAVWD